MDTAQLSAAVVVWTGWGRTPWPARDEERLVSRFGSAAAVQLMPMIRKLEDDFYASDARLTAADLKVMGDTAAADFRRIHPEISEEAVAALTWCYTFDYK